MRRPAKYRRIQILINPNNDAEGLGMTIVRSGARVKWNELEDEEKLRVLRKLKHLARFLSSDNV